MPKAKSKAQARLFGAIAAGKSTKATGMSKAAAKRHVKGVKVKSLPTRKSKKR